MVAGLQLINWKVINCFRYNYKTIVKTAFLTGKIFLNHLDGILNTILFNVD
jgi:hypothetical protein